MIINNMLYIHRQSTKLIFSGIGFYCVVLALHSRGGWL